MRHAEVGQVVNPLFRTEKPRPGDGGQPSRRIPSCPTVRFGACAALLTTTGFLLATPQDSRLVDIAGLEAATRRNPSNASAWKELGLALTLRRQMEPASAAFSKACELDPKDEDSCYYLG